MVSDPGSYTASVVMAIRDDGALIYDVNSWMEERLEMKEIAFTITAEWDGERFNVERSAL